MGPAVTFLGLLGTFPARKTDFALWICLPDEKKKKAWSDLILSHIWLRTGSLTRNWKSWSVDRFPENAALRQVCEDAAAPLYQKKYRRVYNSTLSAEERAVFSRRYDAIISFSPRIFRPLSRKFDWLLYTDAATNHPCIRALLVNPRKTSI